MIQTPLNFADLDAAAGDPGPAPVVGTVGDALNTRALRELNDAGASAVAPEHRKALRRVKAAVAQVLAGDYVRAAKTAMEAVDLAPDFAKANHIAAIALDKMNALDVALSMYERAQTLDPSDPDVYQNLALLAMRMEMFEVAEKLLRIQLKLAPTSAEAANNLGCVLRDQGRYDDAIEVLRMAIYAAQDDPMLWNSMGSIMVEQANFSDAITFYDEAERLNPDIARTHHNRSYALSHADRHTEALQANAIALELGLKDPFEDNAAEFLKASSNLALGNLAAGWEAYKARLSPYYGAYMPVAIPLPLWTNEESLEGKHIIMLGEQGVGDEATFSSCADDLHAAIGPEGSLTIACEPRFKNLFARSFPCANVTTHVAVRKNNKEMRSVAHIEDWSRYDYWAPMGSFLARFRNTREAFPPADGFDGYLKPDPERVAHWRAELDKLGPGPKAGLIWKSGLYTPKRRKHFAPIDAWRAPLQTPGIQWVNLQYNDESDDLSKIRDEFGVEVHDVPGLDLKQDLDDIAALSRALDLVVAPVIATGQIAGGAGANVWFVWSRTAACLLGDESCMPYFPQSRLFSPDTIADWEPAMTKLRTALDAFAAEYRSDERAA
ncbi:MAG: tetratricopeptide repeat protein [Pseudomonadota bacterium]